MNLQEQIRIILKEETQIAPQVLRRHHLIDEMFKGMKTMFGKRYPNCVKNKK